MLAFYDDTIDDAVRPVVDPSWVSLLVMFGPGGAVFMVALWRLDGARRNALKCPHCAAPCSVVMPGPVPNLTRLTGNCTNCGRRLVNEAPAEEPAGPLPTVDEFKAADRRALKPDWSLLVPLAVMVVMLIGVFAIVPGRQERTRKTGTGAEPGTRRRGSDVRLGFGHLPDRRRKYALGGPPADAEASGGTGAELPALQSRAGWRVSSHRHSAVPGVPQTRAGRPRTVHAATEA